LNVCARAINSAGQEELALILALAEAVDALLMRTSETPVRGGLRMDVRWL